MDNERKLDRGAYLDFFNNMMIAMILKCCNENGGALTILDSEIEEIVKNTTVRAKKDTSTGMWTITPVALSKFVSKKED